MKKSILILFMCFPFIMQNVFSQTLINFGMVNEIKKEYKKQRKEYFEKMHKIEKGLNWRLIDRETRLENQVVRAKNIEKLKANGKLKSDKILDESFADGNVTAYWEERGSNNLAGRIHTADIDFSRNLIYAASSGGNIWRGTLEGENWVCLNNEFQFPDIRMVRVVKVNDKNRIIVASNGPSCVYYSDDEGLTWSKSAGLDNAANWGGIKRSVVTAEKNLVYLLLNEWNYDTWEYMSSVYYSNDYASTFNKLYSSPKSLDNMDMWTSKYFNKGVYFLNRDSVTVIDGNNNINFFSMVNPCTYWDDVEYQLLSGYCYGNSTALSVLLYNRTDGQSHFLVAADDFSSWTETGYLEFKPFENNSFTMSEIIPEEMFCGGVDLYRSYNYGSNWSVPNIWSDYYGNIMEKLHADIPGIISFINQEGKEIILMGTDGGLYISYDNLKTVKNLSIEGLNVSQYYSTYTYQADPSIVFAGSQDQGFQRNVSTKTGLFNFEQTISGDYGHLTSSDGGDNLWCVYPGFAMYYQGLAKPSIEKCFTLDFVGNLKLWMAPIVANPKDPKTAFLATGRPNDTYPDKAYICKLEAGAVGLKSSFLAESFDNAISALALSNVNSDYFYIMTDDGSFFYSTDYGENWTKSEKLESISGHYFYGHCILPSNKQLGRVYFSGSGYSNSGVYLTEDNGKTFQAVDNGLPKTMVYDIAQNEDESLIFAATEVGPYVLFVPEMKWYPINGVTAPDQTYWTVEYINSTKTARFGTYGRGIWDFVVTGVTDVPPQTQNNYIANKFDLKAFPNPFNNSTNISFNLVKESNISLKIYDIQGKLIKNLFDGNGKAGYNEISWNGAANGNFKVMPGVYICIVRAEGSTDFIKIVIE